MNCGNMATQIKLQICVLCDRYRMKEIHSYVSKLSAPCDNSSVVKTSSIFKKIFNLHSKLIDRDSVHIYAVTASINLDI